jgi:hypothetical protein
MVRDYDPGNAESPQKHIQRPSHENSEIHLFVSLGYEV